MIRRKGGVRRNYELSVLSSEDKIVVSNLEKVSEKVHNSNSLSEEAKQRRDKTLKVHHNVLKKKESSDLPFGTFQLRRTISNTVSLHLGKMKCAAQCWNLWQTKH